MKKMMTVLAACAVTSLALAEGGVVSGNTVGYQTVTVNEGFNMFAVNWVEIGGNDSIAISNLFGAAQDASLTAGTTFGTADMLKVWNGVGYNSYFYRNLSGTHYWQKVGVAGATTETIPSSIGFWFFKRLPGSTNLTISAQVNLASSFSHVMENGFNLMGSAFPVVVKLNDSLTWNWDASGVQSGTTFGTADMIKVWNGTGYESYFYRYTASSNYWQKVGVPGATSDSIPLGCGAWFYRRGASAINVTQNKIF